MDVSNVYHMFNVIWKQTNVKPFMKGGDNDSDDDDDDEEEEMRDGNGLL